MFRKTKSNNRNEHTNKKIKKNEFYRYFKFCMSNKNVISTD